MSEKQVKKINIFLAAVVLLLCQIVIFRVVGALLSFILKQSLGLGYTINVINMIVYIILGSVIAIYYIKLVEKDKAKILHIILISVAMEFLVRVENDLGHVYGLPNMLNNMIYYVICLGWAIAILYAHRRIPKKKKKGISKNAYDQIVLSRECNALLKNRDGYLEKFAGTIDGEALQELYKHLPHMHNTYMSEVLNKPLSLTKPISPYSAAQLGTMMGGVAVGLVAAQNAIEKQKTYEKNVIDVIKSDISIGNALDKLSYCHASILGIICKNEEVRQDWEGIQEEIKKELRETYIC